MRYTYIVHEKVINIILFDLSQGTLTNFARGKNQGLYGLDTSKAAVYLIKALQS